MTPPVFVISLARAAARRADIRRRLDVAGIRHEIIDAVDGATLDLSQYTGRLSQRLCQLVYTMPLTRNEIGCYLSHYNLWERMVAERIDCALILEDDAEWNDNFLEVVTGVMATQWEWDVVLLHAPPRRGKMRTLCTIGENHCLRQYLRHPLNATAYLIRLSGAKKLKKHCRQIWAPVDYAWKPYWHYNGTLLCVHPAVAKNTDAESVIGTRTRIRAKDRNLWERIASSFIRKYERIGQWFHFHARKPRKSGSVGGRICREDTE